MVVLTQILYMLLERCTKCSVKCKSGVYAYIAGPEYKAHIAQRGQVFHSGRGQGGGPGRFCDVTQCTCLVGGSHQVT